LKEGEEQILRLVFRVVKDWTPDRLSWAGMSQRVKSGTGEKGKGEN
jgi:hypothetical protein